MLNATLIKNTIALLVRARGKLAIVNSGCGGALSRVTGELSPASVYVSLLPVVEACVVVAVPGRVGEVRVPADEPEAVRALPCSVMIPNRSFESDKVIDDKVTI